MEKEKCCHCSQRKKERSPEEYKKLIHRLNRIEGQIRGIKGMVENNAYCPDILIQSAAVNAAINAFNKELLANHIRTCVADNIRNHEIKSVVVELAFERKDEDLEERLEELWSNHELFFEAQEETFIETERLYVKPYTVYLY